jgi:hypothetical protein
LLMISKFTGLAPTLVSFSRAIIYY